MRQPTDRHPSGSGGFPHLVRIVGGVHGQGLAHGSVHQVLQARAGHIHLPKTALETSQGKGMDGIASLCRRIPECSGNQENE